MEPNKSSRGTGKARVPTLEQISAGGVAYRRVGSGLEAAIVSVKPSRRWQLPKGLVDPGESPEEAALREVREEAGLEARRQALIETIEYWYRARKDGKPVRYHKFVHFYLLEYISGDVADHDHEIAEARWVSFETALEMLAFENERRVVEKARKMIEEQRPDL